MYCFECHSVCSPTTLSPLLLFFLYCFAILHSSPSNPLLECYREAPERNLLPYTKDYPLKSLSKIPITKIIKFSTLFSPYIFTEDLHLLRAHPLKYSKFNISSRTWPFAEFKIAPVANDLWLTLKIDQDMQIIALETAFIQVSRNFQLCVIHSTDIDCISYITYRFLGLFLWSNNTMLFSYSPSQQASGPCKPYKRSRVISWHVFLFLSFFYGKPICGWMAWAVQYTLV